MADKGKQAQQHREVERKFVMEGQGALPDLAAVPGIARVGEGEPVILDAIYYDTDTRTLTAHDVSLRRRTGGADAGWHLKRPVGAETSDHRQELRVPLDATNDDEVPAELARVVRSLTRGRPLHAIAALHTERIEHTLGAEDGSTIAVIADDLVSVGRPDDDGEPISWHELEVELVDGDPPFLDAASVSFARAGILPATWPSKVRHALEVLGDETVLALPPAAAPLGHKATVAEVVLARLRANVEVIVMLDAPLRGAGAVALHDVRIAARRLRSALTTFRPFLERDVTDPLRDELKWFGEALGTVRDADVLDSRLTAVAEALPRELSLGPVLDRIRTETRRTRDRSFVELTRVLDEARTYALLDALDALVASPPWRTAAHRQARKALPALLNNEIGRVRRAGRAADDARDEDERLAALHELRKAAKRARYAAESVVVVFGRPAEKLAGRMQDLQDTLGEHQDTVAARAELRRIGALVSGYPNENGFTFGVLHEREAAASDAVLRSLPTLRRRATKRSFDASRAGA